MDINIINLSEITIEKLDILAEKKGVSREELLYKFVMNISNQGEVFNVFTKYENLLKIVENSLNENTKILNRLLELNKCQHQ